MRKLVTSIRKIFRPSPDDIEMRQSFETLTSFETFLADHAGVRGDDFMRSVAKRVRKAGAREPLTNLRIPAGRLAIGDSLREGLVFDGISSRVRAVMLEIALSIERDNLKDPAIYAAEATSALAWRLRSRYLRFIGSEYVVNDADRRALYPVPVIDLQNTGFESDAFDFVVTNEVLEHVPSINRALAEIHRILKPGGSHIGTVPLLYLQQQSDVRARLDGDRVIHLHEPQFHHNPMDVEGGALVFELPGWGILDRARDAGFRDAHISFVYSTRFACMSEKTGGVLVLVLRK